jgi:hypothetical protein
MQVNFLQRVLLKPKKWSQSTSLSF